MKLGLSKKRLANQRLSIKLIYKWFANQPEQLWLGILAITIIVTRWVGHSQFLYSVDAVKYALALDKYDVSIHRPHPMGYALYILFTKPIYWLMGDANTALIIVSIIFSIGALYTLYYLAKKIYGQPTAWVAVSMFISAPVVWFYGQVALNYLSDALFMSWFGYLAYQILSTKKANPRLALWASVVLAISGGFRPTSVLFMAPLWLWMIWRQRSWRVALLNVGVIGLITLSWVWPAAALSGGWLKFWAAVSALLLAPGMDKFVSLNHGLSAAWDQFNMIFKGLLINFNFSSAALVLFLALLAVPRTNTNKINLFNLYFWLVLVLPASLFYIFGVYTLPGYLLVLIPGLTILIARTITILVDVTVQLLAHLPSAQRFWPTAYLISVISLLIAGNTWIYLRSGRQIIEPNVPTHYTIYTIDRLWNNLIPTINQEFNPQNTVIAIDQPFIHWGLEHFQYYFPNHVTYQRIAWGIANPEHKNWYRAYGQRYELVDDLELAPGDNWMVVVRENWNDPVANKLSAITLPERIGHITYYDLSLPSVREFLAQADHVKFINTGNE
ncbi:hypothetical protein A2810_01360 [candidate division Kazan bacterium RIFCSPHIGHO2_01_FULL_49_10]|uniref:Uncharacterized protein n=1 Tax=candidate division Kazan bacterium RIFCSPLOWO2_01_FULL_48_13 TaxID=1798539 RepID=A0A1F4PRN0_UNCK3|nr:MAG: hypothetical protein A2810_01360 [candidate division Kazan bacterium RIFCSPHIGHO2_01_FULL_49_10]OGB85702.1 MAG: hypothetical protein A2994_03025 [candidate division Kazan bacterium RIFCSPLOWO2_01_FULL_48_13]